MRCYYGLVCSLLLISCSSNDSDDIKNKTAEKLYSKARGLLRQEDHEEAASTFKEIETLFPYSSIASDGQVMAAYSYFLASNYQDAMRELEIFLRYHSSHQLVPYVLYLKAMCMYMQVSSVGRDARTAKETKEAFVELVNRFPESAYYKDSVKKIVILDDIIAAHEMLIGRFYQGKSNMLSAISRYNFVVNNYANTNHAPEAFYRIVECCQVEGLDKEAAAAYDILRVKFPNNSWKDKATKIVSKKNGIERKI